MALSRRIGRSLTAKLTRVTLDRFIEAHGGRVTLEGRPGEGATFRLHLPASARPVPGLTPALSAKEPA